jgi:hypothetical protein
MYPASSGGKTYQHCTLAITIELQRVVMVKKSTKLKGKNVQPAAGIRHPRRNNKTYEEKKKLTTASASRPYMLKNSSLHPSSM